MSVDGYARLRRGERRPVTAQVTASSGTMTVQPSPAPLCTLHDAGGLSVSGRESLPVTGFDAGPLASPRLWLLLDASNLAVGFYTLVFAFQASGSDGLTRVYRVCVEVEVEEPS